MADRITLGDRAGRLLDGLLEPFAPRMVMKRMGTRLALQELRQYDAAGHGRRTANWRRTSGSADRETRGAVTGLRNAARELVRNNKYAASALRQMTANVVGDGITARMQHPDKSVRDRAQSEWDRFAESRIDGREDHYGQQKLVFRTAAEGGEGLAQWSPVDGVPDARCDIMEGDLLDHTKDLDTDTQRIVQGVQFDRNGNRTGYWLYPRHPGDHGGYFGNSRLVAAEHVDHVFEALRPGQTRGVSWFAPIAMDLRDYADTEEAILMRHKVEACIGLVLTAADGQSPSGPFAEAGVGAGMAEGNGGSGGRGADTIRPGMIFRARPGETATTIQPTSSGGSAQVMRQRLMGIAANTAPYFLISGDPSQTNYSSQRALMLGFWANIDDWQQNMMIPQFCAPAVRRRMRLLARQTGDRRFLDVKPRFAPPIRRLLDEQRDMAGLEAQLRVGSLSYPDMLAARGIDPEEHLETMAAFFKMADKLGLVFDGDPRRTAGSGALQAPTGYVRPRTTDDE